MDAGAPVRRTNWPVLLITPLTFVLALVAYDVVAIRRLHAASIWARAVLLAGLALPELIGRTSAAHAFVQWLTLMRERAPR